MMKLLHSHSGGGEPVTTPIPLALALCAASLLVPFALADEAEQDAPLGRPCLHTGVMCTIWTCDPATDSCHEDTCVVYFDKPHFNDFCPVMTG